MLCSIIIPCHNKVECIEKNLQALTQLSQDDFEIIIIDDCSKSDISFLKKKYNCIIARNEKNYGPSFSRNRGAQLAAGEILCFIDSDIVLDISKFLKNIKLISHSLEAMAITGGVSLKSPYDNFFSKYKNYYLNYVFNLQMDYVSFLYGSFVMIKKSSFTFWPEDMRYGEDTYLGSELHNRGIRIFFDKELNSIHYKYFNGISILLNDFRIPFFFSKTYVKNIFLNKRQSKWEFSHVLQSQIISIALLGLFVGNFFFPSVQSAFGHRAFSILLIAFWTLLNRKFFSFLYHQENLYFYFASILFTLIDQIVMGAGIFCGLSFYIFKRKECPVVKKNEEFGGSNPK